MLNIIDSIYAVLSACDLKSLMNILVAKNANISTKPLVNIQATMCKKIDIIFVYLDI